ncbi:competence protein CoiA family protein [Natronorarus salvus]|uniref:hypothetical protein n=1 Tax=Natronorarus salvus TaxID=3117733 RepID=UPI002F2618E3
MKMKSIVADFLKLEFPVPIANDGLYIDTKRVGDRRPDVLVIFEEPMFPYGRGIAVECQYRNEAKDRQAVEQEYLDHEISTLWLEEAAFDLEEYSVDLQEADFINVWPKAVEHSEQIDVLAELRESVKQSDGVIRGVPATVHLEWGDGSLLRAAWERGRRLWKRQKKREERRERKRNERERKRHEDTERAEKEREREQERRRLKRRIVTEVRTPNPPVQIIFQRMVDGEVCDEDAHKFVDLREPAFWRECNRCGLADVTLSDLGQNVETPAERQQKTDNTARDTPDRSELSSE